MIKTHPPPQDGTNPAPEIPELNTLLPTLLGDCDHAPHGCDTQSYLAMLDTHDVPEVDKRAVIHTLYHLIETLLGIHFGVDPATLELDARGQKFASDSAPVVNSQPAAVSNSFSVATTKARQSEEGINDDIRT